MAGRGRASVADMARVELAILQSIDAVEKEATLLGSPVHGSPSRLV